MKTLEEKDWPEELVQYINDLEQQDGFCESYKKFQEGCSFEEYCEAIKRVLMNCSYRYDDKRAEELIKECLKCIENNYNKKVPPSDIAIDIGYCCG